MKSSLIYTAARKHTVDQVFTGTQQDSVSAGLGQVYIWGMKFNKSQDSLVIKSLECYRFVLVSY